MGTEIMSPALMIPPTPLTPKYTPITGALPNKLFFAGSLKTRYLNKTTIHFH